MADPHTSFNGIGIHFLSRHLVTLDFPGKTMYLKRVTDKPLVDEEERAAARAVAGSAIKYALRLKRKGELPGWSKDEERRDKDITFNYSYPDTVTFALEKAGKADAYHYTLSRESKKSAWKLEKAWRTDTSGKTVEEYQVK
jgi:hypothetical protein